MAIRAKKIKVEIGEIPKTKEKGVVYFASFEDMNKVLTSKRIEVLETIKEKNPESIYELAQILNKDQGNVTKDVKILEKNGFVEIQKQKTGERVSSKPFVEVDSIEMVVKLGAGFFGMTKDTLTKVSKEFKGEKLVENKKYTKKKFKQTLNPVKKASKKIYDALDK